MHGRGRRDFLMAVGAMLVAPRNASAQAAEVVGKDGLQASARPLGHDQAASFYLARGMPLQMVERYARNCVVVVVLRSPDVAPKISFRLSDWSVRPAGGTAQKIRGRKDWLAELDNEGITLPARMAFEWAQLPEEADMNPGDSIQGMLSIPVKRGSVFDLVVRWQSGSDEHEAAIERIRCD